MAERFLLLMSIITLIANGRTLGRYYRYEAGEHHTPKGLSGSGRTEGRQWLSSLRPVYGEGRLRRFVLGYLLVAAGLSLLYYVVIILYFSQGKLLVPLTVLTGMLAVLAAGRDFYLVQINFRLWLRAPCEDLLTLTAGCWNMILAGVVSLRLFLS